MKNIAQELIRQLHKSSDGEFLYELEHSFELSRKIKWTDIINSQRLSAARQYSPGGSEHKVDY